MPRRPKALELDPFADLAKKVEILEREMSVQRAALDRLKALARPHHPRRDEAPTPARKTA